MIDRWDPINKCNLVFTFPSIRILLLLTASNYYYVTVIHENILQNLNSLILFTYFESSYSCYKQVIRSYSTKVNFKENKQNHIYIQINC